MDKPVIRHSGRFLEFHETELGWEYVIRSNIKGTVGILAITDDRKVVLTEQYRPPVNAPVIELPAGLAGDIPLQEDEPLETAARRELKEETGYEAKTWRKLIDGPSSAGLTNEVVTIFHASGLTRVHEGGGLRGENITVRIIDLGEVMRWCSEQRSEGKLVDFKVFAALYAWKASESGSGGKFWI